MEINEIIKRLESIKGKIATLERNANVSVLLCHYDNGDGAWWDFKVFSDDTDDAELYYTNEYDNLDEIAKNLDNMIVGIKLMLCKEI